MDNALTDLKQGHTSGPWEVEQPMDHELWIVEAGKEAYEWRVIAGCPFPDEKGDISRQQVEANARLIAAAPELLEALQAASAYIGTTDRGAGIKRIADAAIRKATGAA